VTDHIPHRIVGKDIPHDSAVGHVTGESIFLDDIAPLSGELLAGIVPAPIAHGKLKRVDISPATKIPSVATALTARDTPGHNLFGPVLKDEMLLVEDEIAFLGQPLAIIAAETTEALEAARRAIVYELEELPPILTIDEAIAANSYIGQPRYLSRGDIAKGFADADHRIEGALDISGQEHFYLESMIAIAVPGEYGTMTIHSSTQHPSEVQALVAETLGIPFNHVTTICKRMGGGFGGKETQAAQPAMMAALLAAKTRRPVRFVYSKDDDMRFTGKRHPFKIIYRAGFTREGLITAVDLQLYSNGGCSSDLSFAVLERAMLHSDNAYDLPNIRIEGRVCKTNLPSNTAFRGFGGPQGVAGIENIIEEIATALGMDSLDIRQTNCYGATNHISSAPGTPGKGRGEGSSQAIKAHNDNSPAQNTDRLTTPYGQIIRNNVLPELFSTLRQESNYDARRKSITQFNSDSPTDLRGLALTPVKFGISFTRRTLNQANALVNIYLDGSVLVSTGATEMGQGVNTRVRQIVAEELGITYDRVLLAPTSTEKNNNTSPTAASSGTDINGAAAVDACSRLRSRLAEVAAGLLAKETNGPPPDPQSIRFESNTVFDHRAPTRKLPFAELVKQAYEDRVSLGERGFYSTPGVDFNRETGRGTPFLYYTNGVACSEVLIDRFTGEYKCTRADLIMDVGKSINPGIDRGQIVGGFIQGMGWVTTEQLMYGPKGNLWSCSPTTYKIPAITDLPEIFNVRFLDNPHSDRSLYRGKAVGEPPLLLAISVWAAIKNALTYAGVTKPASLALPATGERVLLALQAAKKSTPALSTI
jgi:xanthine dehydrogenase large subunit